MQFRAKDGTDVEQERWGWIVTYSDGSLHQQFSPDGTYNNFASIDLDRVARITMFCFENGKTYSVDLPKDAKLIHYYDNIIQQPIGGTAIHHRLFCFGYEVGDTKKIFTLLPTDVVVHGEVENVEVL